MKRKYNDKSDKFADWTTKKLKSEARAYHWSINVAECYGVSDLRNQSGILAELNRRGIESHTELVF